MKECFPNKGKVCQQLECPRGVSSKITFWLGAVWLDLVDIHMKIIKILMITVGIMNNLVFRRLRRVKTPRMVFIATLIIILFCQPSMNKQKDKIIKKIKNQEICLKLLINKEIQF